MDNEELGRKKSKVCCIFKRNREFGESSDDSSSSDSSDSSDDSDIGDGKRDDKAGNDKRGCDKGHDHGQNHHHEHQKPGRRLTRRPPSQNAYEKMPKIVRKKKEGTSETLTQS